MSLHVHVVRVGSTGQESGLVDPGVLAAVDLVGGLLGLGIPEDAFPAALTGCLTHHYGAANTTHEQDPVQYVWVWDAELLRWLRVCRLPSRYLIDDGGGSKLRVSLEVGDSV